MKNLSKIPKSEGVYVLFITVDEDVEVEIGRSRRALLKSGWYIYVGSAKGFGGLRGRIARHVDKHKTTKHWHIDYVTTLQYVNIPYTVYALVDRIHDYESLITNRVALHKCFQIAVPGFGSSDKKRDVTHLFRCVCTLEECIRSIEEVFRAFDLNPIRVSLTNS